jgi:hypothetical protein
MILINRQIFGILWEKKCYSKSMEQFMVTNHDTIILLPTILSSTVKAVFLRFCIVPHETKIKRFVPGRVRLIFTVRGIQNLEMENMVSVH